jgi:hypothetical protein
VIVPAPRDTMGHAGNHDVRDTRRGGDATSVTRASYRWLSLLTTYPTYLSVRTRSGYEGTGALLEVVHNGEPRFCARQFDCFPLRRNSPLTPVEEWWERDSQNAGAVLSDGSSQCRTGFSTAPLSLLTPTHPNGNPRRKAAGAGVGQLRRFGPRAATGRERSGRGAAPQRSSMAPADVAYLPGREAVPSRHRPHANQ